MQMKTQNQSNEIKSKINPKSITQITNSTLSAKHTNLKTKKKKKQTPQSGKRSPSEEKDNKAKREKRSKTSMLNESPQSEEEKTEGIFAQYANVISEKGTKESMKRLIETSNDLLMKQNGILDKCDDLAKVISANDYEVDRLVFKQERENFPQVINEYSGDLESILNKLRKNTAELDEAKRLREENNSLRYKLEILSIDKNDDYLTIESKINSMRNVYTSEINSMINFFNEIGLDNPLQKINPSNFTEDKVIQFFSLCKKHFKSLKNTIVDQEEKINYLSKENLKISEEIDQTKRKADHLLRKKNMEFGNSIQMVDTHLSNNFCPYNVEQLKSQSQSQMHSQSQLLSQSNNQSQYPFASQSPMLKTNQDQFQGGTSQSIIKDDRSFIEVYRRNKDILCSNDDNDDLALEHKYTDSCFYQQNEDNNLNQNQSYTYSRKNNSNVFY